MTALQVHLLIAFAIPILLFLSAFVVGCVEKRAIRHFTSVETRPDSLYCDAMIQPAIANGFIRLIDGVHTKYDTLFASLLCSADWQTLAVISDGTMLNIRARKTYLVSQLADGSVLMTVDDPGTCEFDPQTHRQIVLKATFDELWKKHTSRLMKSNRTLSFAQHASWSTLDEISSARVGRIVGRGLATYVGNGQDFYRYTVWGSFRASIIHGIGQVFIPKNWMRHRRRRPG